MRIALWAGLVALVAMTGAANAQATRTWVSGVGDDANPCSRTAPCKTFAGAISKTTAGGVINCLDPAGFGAITITKSISLECVGVLGGVLSTGANAINLSAAATDTVYLTGLQLNGVNTGTTGITVNSVGTLHIKDTSIREFLGSGLSVTPSSGAVLVTVENSFIADNGGGGILIRPTGSGAVRATLNTVIVTRNGADGVFANANVTSGNARVFAKNVESSHNTNDGFTTFSNSAPAQIVLESSAAFNNARGVNASGTAAIVRFARSNVTANGTGVNQDTGGQVLSYGNNNVDGNGTDGTFGTTPQK